MSFGESVEKVLTEEEGQNAVYVSQGEWACALLRPDLVIGSDEATSCVIVVACDQERVVCAHLASKTEVERSLPTMLAAVKSPFNVFLVGGREEAGKSVADAILAHLAGSSCTIKLAYLGEESGPMVQGCAFLAGENRLVRAKWLKPARGPFQNVRSIRWLADGGSDGLMQVYNCGTWSVHYEWDHSMAERIRFCLENYSDEEMLNSFSTTPSLEAPDFVANLRAKFRFYVDNRNPFADGPLQKTLLNK